MAWQSDEPGYKAAAGGWNVVFARAHCYFDMKESPCDTWGILGRASFPCRKSTPSIRSPGRADQRTENASAGRGGLSLDRVHHLARAGRLQDLAAAVRPGGNGLDSAAPPQFRRLHGSARDRRPGAAGLLDVAYRVPDPELQTTADGIVISPPFAGAEIHYTTDGSEPTLESPRWTGEAIHADASQPVAACTFMPGGRRSLVATTAKSKK